MSYSTYAQPFKIPDGFPELLAELTTEILREQPEDATGIYKFAYEFFLRKQQGFEEPTADQPVADQAADAPPADAPANDDQAPAAEE